MSNHDDDNNLDEYLMGNSKLSSLYAEDQDIELPSIDLDNSILAAAKREVNSKPHTRKKNYSPFSNSYLIPLSTAASMLIVVAVVSFFPSQQVDEQAAGYLDITNSSEQIVMEQEVLHAKQDNTDKAESKLKSRKLSQLNNTNIKRQKLEQHTKSKEKIDRNIKEQQKLESRNLTKSKKIRPENMKAPLIEQKIVEKKPKQILPKTSIELVNSIKPSAVTAEISESVVASETEKSADSRDSEAMRIGSLSSFSSFSKKNSKLFYNKKEWQSLPAHDWLVRIRKIAKLYGENATKEIIKDFNEKFPAKKIDYRDFFKK